jgi:cell division protein FtsX
MIHNTRTKGRAVPEKQVVLPLKKSFEIAVKSIRARFARTMITTVSLVLAISFYSYITTNTAVVSGIFAAGDSDAVQSLTARGYDPPPPGQAHTMTPKERWILFLSLLVCVVGIVNTQLMAVTDRFREIGTMKCLGALDRFVLRLFLIEAGLQGLAGSLGGAVAGAAMALAGGYMKFGSAAVAGLEWETVAGAVASATGLGCGLSILGVIYPAFVAARMQPVEAMRGRD